MKRILLSALLLAVSFTAAATEIAVYKSPTCGCCSKWVRHLEANGFRVKSYDVKDVNSYKDRYGVPVTLGSCHTAIVDGYVVEGHVPAADIKRLLAERPAIKGIAVPGMPAGSPGMEGPVTDRYDVLSFDANGETKTFARH
jgi:hypothetical protein